MAERAYFENQCNLAMFELLEANHYKQLKSIAKTITGALNKFVAHPVSISKFITKMLSRMENQNYDLKVSKYNSIRYKISQMKNNKYNRSNNNGRGYYSNRGRGRGRR